MCGIAGFIDFGGTRSRGHNDALARVMERALEHRGPDGGDVWADAERGVWLVHRRLSIIDVSTNGDQPMVADDGAVLIWNGEGYNADRLRPELAAAGYRFRGHSDTEVVLNGFRHWGVEETCARLIGMFAFAYWEPNRDRLTLGRDRLGKKPLYWSKTPRGLMFGSDLAALRLHPDCPREIDHASVASYLRTGCVAEPDSILAGVSKVRPGGLLAYDLASGAVTPSTYWSVVEAARRGLADPLGGSPADAVAAAGALLEDAVALRMISDVPLGAFLSGGIDSSLVVALMQARSSRPVKTFSIGYHDRAYDESDHAAAVARHLGTDHEALMVTAEDAMRTIPLMPSIYTEPFADVSQIPTYLVASMARSQVTVALTGDGGDEVFAGYNRHVAAGGLLGRLNGLPGPVRRALSGGMTALSPRRWDALLGLIPESRRPRNIGEKLHKLAPLLGRSEPELYRSLVSQWADVGAVQLGAERAGPIDDAATFAMLPDLVARMRWLDMVTFLPDDILVKIDRATMAVGLEARAPLLDHRLVELSWRIPSSVHLHQGQGKWILRALLARHVPPALFERPKAGFGIPIGAWLRGPLRDWAESLLSARALDDAGLVRTAAVRAVWRRHLAGQVNAQYGLWTVLMLQAWHQAFTASRPARLAA
ncbi:MAG: asparagine synthase (glutamine-hydrolyzing) [Pseudomonadota bacterium]|nr:asparagine synthase (glutamine-hydrolyzing) [Pseudomonadota bacterium]